ncbi:MULTISPECIES: NADP-dependent isocitrate dehydrogenase [unclassified Polaribacter]|uniref:NADP-dependent isocitrate dehydrogenase n=1 Tax=unclassified Polaribacter TaxID=196858 RepID=UPI0011BEF1DE|nr:MULTISPECIES: NADP-dependent isocitrate dehydrogenase [unclassified Polaribacter]TXD53659.1 NADP-dependent isocitrate dehydrogenase [Polaribacter sp. IC063]TXD62114.1 NADP-dependent isocitrate dehydrogenase [Polaribacter sp. IC066]
MENIQIKQKEKNVSKSTITRVAVAHGDGIGPEIMDATLRILEAAGANIEAEKIEVGEKVYLSGNSAGIEKSAWEVINRNKLILKAPITTPQGKGYKSLNVTLRKSLGLFANVRPVNAYAPYVKTNFAGMDVVIVRENEEDLYAGIEHQQTQDVVQCLKLITRPGCEKIVRYAFEYAQAYGRKKVTCMVKDNIMKLTDGLFHSVFKEIAAEYPNIESNSQIIDIGSAKLAANPENYDVIVTSNLYGDIISDIAAEIAGSVGMAGSANIGTNIAMFEAIHGSAPDIAGKKIANPSGLLNAAVMMLSHVGKTEIAYTIKNAWLTTLEKGYHTADVYQESISKELVSTSEFASKVIENLGNQPTTLPISNLAAGNGEIVIPVYKRKEQKQVLVGVDVFINWQGTDATIIGDILSGIDSFKMKLKMITNRGVKVYPEGMKETYCTDHWRCRFVDIHSKIEGNLVYNPVDFEKIIALLSKLNNEGFQVIKIENLYEFDGKRGFSLGQGE